MYTARVIVIKLTITNRFLRSHYSWFHHDHEHKLCRLDVDNGWGIKRTIRFPYHDDDWHASFQVMVVPIRNPIGYDMGAIPL